MARDSHHILFNKQEWRLRPEARALREHPSLIALMERGDHEELHGACPPVPLLGYNLLTKVRREYYPQREPLRSMDDLCIAIGQAAKHPSIHDLERRQADLTIEAVQLQRPFIEEGLVVVTGVRTIIDLGAGRVAA